MVYSLIEGLTALGAFGILIIVNNNIYDYIKRTELNKDEKITAMYLFFPILGIAYLTGFLGHIIINSEFILVKNIDFFILFALILTIVITHFKLFDDLISNYFEGTTRLKLSGIVCAIWTGLLILFMTSPNQKNAVSLFIVFLFPIMLRISPKLKEYDKKNNYNILIITITFGIFILVLYLIILSGISGWLINLLLIISSIPFIYELSLIRKTEKSINLKKMMEKVLKFKYIFLIIIFLIFFLSPFYISPLLVKNMEKYAHNEKTNDDLNNLALEITSNYSDDKNKTNALLNWFDKSPGNIINILGNPLLLKIYPLHICINQPYICIRINDQENPEWILKSRCGACGEYSMFFMEIADKANLKVRSIHDKGYDHNWDEVLIDGKWIIVDPSIVDLENNETGFNISNRYYDQNWDRLGMSYVYALYPNKTTEDVTYRYTNLTNLTLTTTDENGKTIPNVDLILLSNNHPRRKNIDTTLQYTTDSEGKCTIKVGGGNYTIISNIDNNGLHMYNKSTLTFFEDEIRSFSVILKKDNLWWIQYIPQRLILIISIILICFILSLFIAVYSEIKKY